MKKEDKEKYEINFGDLVISKEEFFNTVELSKRYYLDYAIDIFQQKFNQLFEEYSVTLTSDQTTIDEVKLAIYEEFESQYRISIIEYINIEEKSRKGIDELDSESFLKSITEEDIVRIKDTIKNKILPYSLTLLRLFSVLNTKDDFQEAIKQSNEKFASRNNNEKYTKFYSRAKQLYISREFNDSQKAALKQAIKEIGTQDEYEEYVNNPDNLRKIQAAFSDYLKRN